MNKDCINVVPMYMTCSSVQPPSPSAQHGSDAGDTSSLQITTDFFSYIVNSANEHMHGQLPGLFGFTLDGGGSGT